MLIPGTLPRMRATWTLLLLAACYAAPDEMTIDTPAPASVKKPMPDAPPPSTPQVLCDMSKFSFTQEIGCVNDGWIEFCADKGGAPTTTALRAIAPDVSIQEGMIGHAGCNEMTEYLVSQPVHMGDCTAPLGALVDAAWNTLCALSQVPETKHFVPGFAE